MPRLPLPHWVDPRGRAAPHPIAKVIKEAGYPRVGQGLLSQGRKPGESEVHGRARLPSTPLERVCPVIPFPSAQPWSAQALGTRHGPAQAREGEPGGLCHENVPGCPPPRSAAPLTSASDSGFVSQFVKGRMWQEESRDDGVSVGRAGWGDLSSPWPRGRV